MPVPSQEYDSWYPFVWCVWAFDFAIWLETFLFEFSIFVISIFYSQNITIFFTLKGIPVLDKHYTKSYPHSWVWWT